MKSYLTLAVFILLSSSASRACGGSFFKPPYEDTNKEDTGRVKPVVAPKGRCTACGAAIMTEYLTTTMGTKTVCPQEDKTQPPKK